MYFGGNVSQRIKKLTNLDVQFFILSLKFFKNHFSVILKITHPCSKVLVIHLTLYVLLWKPGRGRAWGVLMVNLPYISIYILRTLLTLFFN